MDMDKLDSFWGQSNDVPGNSPNTINKKHEICKCTLLGRLPVIIQLMVRYGRAIRGGQCLGISNRQP